MGRPLRKLILNDGGNEKALQELEIYGWSFFCERWECQPDTANRWLREQGGHEDDSVYRYDGEIGSGGGNITAQDLVDAWTVAYERLVHRLSELEDKVLERDEIIADLRAFLKRRQEIDRAMAQPLFEAIKSKEP